MSTEACTLLFLNTVIMPVADHSFSDVSSVTLVAFFSTHNTEIVCQGCELVYSPQCVPADCSDSGGLQNARGCLFPGKQFIRSPSPLNFPFPTDILF